MLCTVVRFIPESSRYVVQDVMETQGKSGSKTKYTIPRRNVIPLCKSVMSKQCHKRYCNQTNNNNININNNDNCAKNLENEFYYEKGSRVLALYPQTTCFYIATVIQEPYQHITSMHNKKYSRNSSEIDSSDTNEYIIIFDGDEDVDGKCPPRNISQRFVIADPDS